MYIYRYTRICYKLFPLTGCHFNSSNSIPSHGPRPTSVGSSLNTSHGGCSDSGAFLFWQKWKNNKWFFKMDIFSHCQTFQIVLSHAKASNYHGGSKRARSRDVSGRWWCKDSILAILPMSSARTKELVHDKKSQLFSQISSQLQNNKFLQLQ